MSSDRDKARAPGCGIVLLSAGLIGLALGGGILVTLLLTPAGQNDANFGLVFLSYALVPISSLLVLISLFLLKVHQLLWRLLKRAIFRHE